MLCVVVVQVQQKADVRVPLEAFLRRKHPMDLSMWSEASAVMKNTGFIGGGVLKLEVK